MVSKAEQTLADKLDSQNDNIALRAAEIVLRSQAAKDQGWGA